VLVDGESLTIRPVAPSDTAALIEMHRGFSKQTVYQRFLAIMPELALLQAARFTHVDGNHRVALVVQDSAGHLVAVGRYDRMPPDDRRAEVAFVVADRYQHHGLGTTLVRLLMAHAAAAGVETFLADVLTTNFAMHRTFADAGLVAEASYDAGVSHLVMPLGSARASGRVGNSDGLASKVPTTAVPRPAV
jgi:RimJ/RimL family protein N-acetyltransferase